MLRRLRLSVRLSRRRTIIPRRRLCRTIVRGRLIVRSWPVGLRRICSRPLVRSRRVSRTVPWLAARFRDGRRSRLSRRCLLNRRTRRRRGSSRGLYARHLLPRYRLPGMSCQRLLPGCEGHRRRRRFRFCDHCTARHCGRRCRHAIGRTSVNSQHTVGCGCDRCSGIHRRGGNIPCVHRDCRACNGLSARERPLRNGCDRS